MNSDKPGLPDYTGPVRGWFAYIHHEMQLEWSDNIQERVAYIVMEKPANEQAIRLACLTHIPTAQVPVAYATARQAYATAGQAYDTAWRAYDTAWQRMLFDAASIWLTSTRHSWSTAGAEPSEVFQNRGRLRRTYQLERSSTNASSACVARRASKSSSAAVASRSVAWRRERIQRSMMLELATAVSASGCHPSRFA